MFGFASRRFVRDALEWSDKVSAPIHGANPRGRRHLRTSTWHEHLSVRACPGCHRPNKNVGLRGKDISRELSSMRQRRDSPE